MSLVDFFQFLFWFIVFVIFYTYIGFIVVLFLRAKFDPKPIFIGTDIFTVSLVIVAHNEAEFILKKIDNAFALNYPEDKLEIIIASDGSDDGMDALVRNLNHPRIKLLSLPRKGKNQTLNSAVFEASGEILVFSDADSMLGKNAIRDLVAPFCDDAVGGVGGDYRYDTEVIEGRGERTYWSYDWFLKSLQTKSGSMTSATGQIYAIRRKLFQPVPDGVTDDSYISYQVPSAYYRMVFEPEAFATGPIAGSSLSEFSRKVRIFNRGLNSVWLNRHLLNPFNYGFYAIQLFTHKVLRRLMVWALILAFVFSIVLLKTHWLYALAFVGQAVVYVLGLVGFILHKTAVGQSKIFSLPLYFLMVNIAAMIALLELLRGKRYISWGAERAESNSE